MLEIYFFYVLFEVPFALLLFDFVFQLMDDAYPILFY